VQYEFTNIFCPIVRESDEEHFDCVERLRQQIHAKYYHLEQELEMMIVFLSLIVIINNTNAKRTMGRTDECGNVVTVASLS
jgi:hypothetical protein